MQGHLLVTSDWHKHKQHFGCSFSQSKKSMSPLFTQNWDRSRKFDLWPSGRMTKFRFSEQTTKASRLTKQSRYTRRNIPSILNGSSKKRLRAELSLWASTPERGLSSGWRVRIKQTDKQTDSFPGKGNPSFDRSERRRANTGKERLGGWGAEEPNTECSLRLLKSNK